MQAIQQLAQVTQQLVQATQQLVQATQQLVEFQRVELQASHRKQSRIRPVKQLSEKNVSLLFSFTK
ncbi:hypothetical protein [Candidatus Nitrotoga fabula]|uniref:hypothetical protein n=1 Tax=Candidatus Nitrotoga fabula TaxID=2182327 RepID=UPI001BB4720D|nr:hypothetical protein [Candidatus Nitrotoga fabula]